MNSHSIISVLSNVKNYYKYVGTTPFYRYYHSVDSDFYGKFSPFNSKNSVGINAIDANIVIDKKRNFIYNRIQKNANTTLMASLFKYECTDEDITDKEIAKKYKSIKVRASRLTQSETNDVKNYFKFVFVRNPYSRVLSAYLNKIYFDEVKRNHFRKISPNLFKGNTHIPTFREFCEYLHQGLYDDVHWAPQADLIGIPLSEFDFIGKVEDFDSDLNTLKKIIPNIITTNTGTFNNASSKIDKYFDERCISIVNKLYVKDFSSFGYELI